MWENSEILDITNTWVSWVPANLIYFYLFSFFLLSPSCSLSLLISRRQIFILFLLSLSKRSCTNQHLQHRARFLRGSFYRQSLQLPMQWNKKMMMLAPPGRIFFVRIEIGKGKLTSATFNNMLSLYYLSSLCLSLKMLVFLLKRNSH